MGERVNTTFARLINVSSHPNCRRNNTRTRLVLGIASAGFAFASATNSLAWPTVDECASGTGCISVTGGAKGTFNFTAFWDVDTHSQNGQLSYTDSSAGGLSLSSSLLIDYSVLTPTTRAFAYSLAGTAYSEARLFVTDNGSSGDTFQLQLLDLAGVPIYDTLAQPLNAVCAGGVSIGSCAVPSPCQLQVSAACSVSNPAQAPSGDSCAIIGDSAQVTFYYTIKNAGSSSVSLGSLSAWDAFGALNLSSLGSGSLASGQQVTLVVSEIVNGPFPFVNSVEVSGGSGQCSDMATVTVNQQPPAGGGGGGTTGGSSGGGGNPPPQECEDFVTGGGWIVGTPSGAKANFGVHGGIRKGSFWGGFNYIDHGTGMHVKSTATTGYSVTGDVCRQINFNVTINGSAGTAVVNVCDNGEPGRNDTFQITLSNGYKASGDLGGARPGGGNLQLHKPKCKDQKQKGK